MAKGYDVAVVGLGAVGSAALYALSKLGARAIGIDQFAPPHDRGSSHGDTRITRQAIGEGVEYTPFALRTNAIIEEAEAALGIELLVRCGFVFITRDDLGTAHHGRFGFLAEASRAAMNHGVPHELLDAEELRRQFPQFHGLAGDERAYYDPGGGYLRPEQSIDAMLQLARRPGVDLALNTKLLSLALTSTGVVMKTDRDTYCADQVIMCTGAWLTRLAPPPIARALTVHRQVLHWFSVDDSSCWRPGRSPTYIWVHGLNSAEQFYGFPPLDGAVKIATEQYHVECDPNENMDAPSVEESKMMWHEHAAGRLHGVAPAAVRTATCMYTASPDRRFVIAPDPNDARVLYVSACSGHGFKHAAAVGEAVAHRALGAATGLDLSTFALSPERIERWYA